jgi:hypothetical protein
LKSCDEGSLVENRAVLVGMKLGLQFSILAIPAILAINQAATTRLKWGLTRDL